MWDNNPAELRALAAKSSCIQLVYEWASCEIIAIDVWKKEENYRTCPDHEWFIWQMNEMQLPRSPVMPNLVRNQIEFYLPSILKKVTKWICYYHDLNFFHDEPASSLKEYLLKLIWKPDRSIDYVATAKNVLAGSNFNAMEKYRFACTYCFSEEIWNLRDMAEVTIDWCFEEEPLLVYWSKCLTGQLHTITLPANDSIEEVMFVKAWEKFDLWQPMKYFFGKLDSSARLLQGKNVILHKCEKYLHKCEKYQEEVLTLLNECERDTVYRENLEILFSNYFGMRDNFEGVRRLYTTLKGKLSFKDLTYILTEVSSLAVSNFNVMAPLLMEIWNDASDEYKQQVISTGLRSLIAKEFEVVIDDGRYDDLSHRDRLRDPLGFFRALAEAYEPLDFLKSNFFWLVIWQPVASIVELFDEFQFNAEDVEELKRYCRKNPDKMREVCLVFLEYGHFDEFSSFISFCYSDDNASRIAYQRRLLMDLDRFSHTLMRIDWRIVYKFVNDVFCDTCDGFASYYTTRMILHVLENSKLYDLTKIDNIVECIHTFVPHHTNLSRVKETCIDSLFNYRRYPIFKWTQFEKILIWCYGTETGVAEFKEKINVSEIFLTLLRSCVNLDRYEYTFEASDSMEEFLHWYYPLESERKAFKLEMIYSYGEFSLIGELLKQKEYRRIRRCMLNWFFENNAHEIKEFITKIYV
ncbi:uncharacterized protein LOC135844070 [Planococcus citri]|uniref:uncharacterized protein LOC135844070 n=1 Tax=Planococcus citri TaxID=170843 RepID=UPI0031F7AD1A